MLQSRFAVRSHTSTRLLAIIIISVNAVLAASQTSYKAEIDDWHKARLTELRGEDGWLTLAGLFWLKPGDNTVGSKSDCDVELPRTAPENAGVIAFKDGHAVLTLSNSTTPDAGQAAGTSIELKPDTDPSPSIVRFGNVSLALIKRGDRFGIRVKDKESESRSKFPGLEWFAADPSYRVTARFEAFDKPQEVAIPNVLGDSYKMVSTGIIRFQLNGKEESLQPVMEDDKLFIIFRDLTTGKTTYGAGRFLYADAPVNGTVVLDFNKAFNPPCAFTPFATCPLPPKQNRLDISIEAGEKNFHHSGDSK